MIDNSISDPKNKFGLIRSCIFKVMNFLIFRNFLDFLNIFNAIFLFLKKLKEYIFFIIHKLTWQDIATR